MTSMSPSQAMLTGAGILLIVVSVYLFETRQDMAWIWPAWIGALAFIIAIYDIRSSFPSCRDS